MYKIRPLHNKDLYELNKLQSSLGYKEVQEIIGYLYGAFDDTNLIGIVGIFPYKRLPHIDYPNGYIAEIGALYVKEQYRSQGVATKLLEYALDDSKTLGLDAYVIDCTLESYNIFKKLGFVDSTENRMWKVTKI